MTYIIPREMAPYPHCDQEVLHAPGECEFCDQYADFQGQRLVDGVNFTGHSDPGFKPCPSDARRGLAGAHVWPGNRPA